jgi:hypothetical protein
MKNLMNKVFIVLVASALCASSMSQAMENIARIRQLSGARDPYTIENKNNKNATVNADLAAVEKIVAGNKDAMNAAKSIRGILAKHPMGSGELSPLFRNGRLGDESLKLLTSAVSAKKIELAKQAFDKEQTKETTKELATATAEGSIIINNLDADSTGLKKWIPSRKKLMAAVAVGSGALLVAGVAFGAPAFLKPFVPGVATSIANSLYSGASTVGAALGLQEGGSIYSAVSATGSALGLQEGGRIYGAAQKVKSGLSNARGYLPSKEDVQRYFGYGLTAKGVVNATGMLETTDQNQLDIDAAKLNADKNMIKAAEARANLGN